MRMGLKPGCIAFTPTPRDTSHLCAALPPQTPTARLSLLQPDSLHASVRLARIIKPRHDDQAMTLRNRIALIRARTSADLSELQERQSHMLLLRVEQGNLGA